ncbi:MAG: hypothetical protein LBG99_08550 [Propionibacteriaceae bacterium]|jgi:hypothetical protein|nr:hypothetical protein [Propionibacteriaceae bacterium]
MDAFDPAAQQRIDGAPLPTKKTLQRRRNPVYQLIRLAAINIKMIKVIAASHH